MKIDLKRSLIIGYGSIGRRHEEVLRNLGVETAVVSRHASDLACPCFSTIHEAIDAFLPQYIVVANRTSEHLDTLDQIESTGFRGICLVEKPLADHAISSETSYGFRICVGYVMRFHPLIKQALGLLKGKRLLSIDAYVGQYLPDWRPGTDYRECYSASKAQGGGVLRDLSHELDYLMLLAGPWQQVAALGGHVSELEIDTDDVFALLMKTEDCPVVLCQMNYLDRNVRRDCTIQYEGGTLSLDFVANRLIHNGVIHTVEVERNELFEAMHLASWTPDLPGLCSFNEAAQTLNLIEAAEKSSKQGSWVCRRSQ